jgi:oligopeptide/dipeptide ABC transporter ATP-binding protein
VSLLALRDLSLSFPRDKGRHLALNGVSFALSKGECLAIVGESGCGKSITALSILRLIDAHLQGEILWQGEDLLKFPESMMRKVRGRKIAMIFQDPMSSLNPLMRVIDQVSEVCLLHNKPKSKAQEVLIEVGVHRVEAFPHELSGGLRQRVMIAMALVADPELLIADEPTTALDVSVQAQILDLMREMQKKRQMAILLITHDLGVVAQIADRVAVMYGGELMEAGSVEDILHSPKHPYTKALLHATPRIDQHVERLYTIPGTVEAIADRPVGCVFSRRCEKVGELCQQKPAYRSGGEQRMIRCHYAD